MGTWPVTSQSRRKKHILSSKRLALARLLVFNRSQTGGQVFFCQNCPKNNKTKTCLSHPGGGCASNIHICLQKGPIIRSLIKFCVILYLPRGDNSISFD